MQRTIQFDALPSNGTSTSRRAAASMVDHAPSQQARVLDFIRDSKGVTRDEIAAGLNLKIQSVCARCNSLLKARLIRGRGERKTESGRMAEVLEAIR
jgi:DNA-binding MarR family transcriptional regulator